MDWTSIIVAILSGTTLGGIYEAVKYRRQNAKIKENEVKQNDVETQRQQIELADLYKEKMLEMMDLLNAKQDKGNLNQERMLSMLSSLDTRVDTLEVDMAHVKGFLDGELNKWVAEHQRQAREGGDDES